ncbi:hypothetical protein M8J75_010194 [Diaphorina citri]|nr:hypothetical protein M8J75_010194 [Diaphorina citri]
MVEPQHAATAGMFGAACLITGVIFYSILFQDGRAPARGYRGMVEPQHAATAGMFGAACLITGVIFYSILFQDGRAPARGYRGMVEPQHAATAGMFGAACLITGVIFYSILFQDGRAPARGYRGYVRGSLSHHGSNILFYFRMVEPQHAATAGAVSTKIPPLCAFTNPTSSDQQIQIYYSWSFILLTL